MPVSGPVLCEKAAQLHKLLHDGESVPPFQASRVGFGVLSTSWNTAALFARRKVSSDTTMVEPVKKQQLQELLERVALILEQLYNCDEIGLCYRMLPSKTLASRSE